MPISKKKILTLLEETQVGFSNAKTEEALKEKLIPEGYDDARLDELLEINNLLRTRYQAYEHLSGEQMTATDKLMETFQKEMQEYSTSRQISRKTFSDDIYRGLRSEFGLDQRMRTDFEGFIEQATQYYEASLKNQEAFRKKRTLTARLSSETIMSKLADLDALKQLNTAQENAKGKANVAREERDSTYFELRMYWGNFKISCRNIFRDSKEYLKILKIKPKKKRKPEGIEETPGEPVTPPAPSSPADGEPTANTTDPASPAAPVSTINPSIPETSPDPVTTPTAAANGNTEPDDENE